jgi:hypothetical protein
LNFEGTKFLKNDGTCNYFWGFTPKKSIDVEKILINGILLAIISLKIAIYIHI